MRAEFLREKEMLKNSKEGNTQSSTLELANNDEFQGSGTLILPKSQRNFEASLGDNSADQKTQTLNSDLQYFSQFKSEAKGDILGRRKGRVEVEIDPNDIEEDVYKYGKQAMKKQEGGTRPKKDFEQSQQTKPNYRFDESSGTEFGLIKDRS